MRLGKKNAQHHTQATDFTNPTANNLFGVRTFSYAQAQISLYRLCSIFLPANRIKRKFICIKQYSLDV